MDTTTGRDSVPQSEVIPPFYPSILDNYREANGILNLTLKRKIAVGNLNYKSFQTEKHNAKNSNIFSTLPPLVSFVSLLS
jgi:hypothetical protein